MSRVVLLAMNNPLHDDPRHALAPPTPQGHRLWEMLHAVRPDLCRADYLRAFDRRNLVAGREWSGREAVAAVSLFTAPPGSTVVVLGSLVAAAFGLRRELVHPQGGVPGGPHEHLVFRQLPHPSGRNLFYHHPTHRLLAGLLLAELYEVSLEGGA